MPDTVKLPDADKIREWLIHFNGSQTTLRLKKYYAVKSLMETLGQERKETTHSKFLTWLLASDEYHGIGNFAVQKLLQLVADVLVNGGQGTTSRKFPTWWNWDFIHTGRCEIKDYSVRAEVPVIDEAGKKGRIDILIEGDFVVSNDGKSHKFKIILENKVKSNEHDNQTCIYENWAKQRSEPDTLLLFLFLTPLSTRKLRALETPQSECKSYIQINYQYLLEYILLPAKIRTSSKNARFMISDYIRALSVPALLDDNGDRSKELIMGVSWEEQKLLLKFDRENASLISAALAARALDPDAAPDEKAAYQESSRIRTPVDYRQLLTNKEFLRDSGMENGHCSVFFKQSPKKYVDAFPADLYISEDNMSPRFSCVFSENETYQGIRGSEVSRRYSEKFSPNRQTKQFAWKEHWAIRKAPGKYVLISKYLGNDRDCNAIHGDVSDTNEESHESFNQDSYNLLSDFWDMNKGLILAALNARLLDPELEDDRFEELSSAIGVIFRKPNDFRQLLGVPSFLTDSQINNNESCMIYFKIAANQFDEVHPAKMQLRQDKKKPDFFCTYDSDEPTAMSGNEISKYYADKHKVQNTSGSYQWAQYWAICDKNGEV